MQKIFSARLDEAALDELHRVTRRLGISKRQFLEEAIRLRAREADRTGARDVWGETLGAWRRRESPQATVTRARQAWRRGFECHHRRHARVHR